MIILARGAAIRYKLYNGPRFNVHSLLQKWLQKEEEHQQMPLARIERRTFETLHGGPTYPANAFSLKEI